MDDEKREPNKKYLYIAFLIASIGYGVWWLTTPHSFEECVQKYLKDAHTDRATAILYASCKRQFPKQ